MYRRLSIHSRSNLSFELCLCISRQLRYKKWCVFTSRKQHTTILFWRFKCWFALSLLLQQIIFWPTQIYFLSVTCFLIFIFTRTLFGCTQVSQGPGLVSGRHSVTSDASVTSQLEQLRLSSVEREFRRRVAEYHRQNGEDSNSVCCTKIVVRGRSLMTSRKFEL